MINTVKNNAAKAAKTKPVLSILIPYYKDDPSALLRALLAQTKQQTQIEILIYDDGTNDDAIYTSLSKIAKSGYVPVRLLFSAANKGRASARNTLKQNAYADWVLFLDADMLPSRDDFIVRYLTEIISEKTDVIFGGFTVQQQISAPNTELHRAFSQTSDCLSAKERTKSGPQYVCSSNLCVRSKILDAEPFDIHFKGWGWEDSEWAARIASKYRLRHADIPALHLGLESTETLLKRFKDSASNYVYFTNKHPELAKTLTLYKLSQKLRHVPGQKLSRPLLASTVRSKIIPTKLRLIALKLWRASWYAEAFS
ncbi:MAG: glycosyltransferase family A protein [Robiginitomaculum sp.]